MIDINFTLGVQAVNFLLLLWFLNSFIFKPVLRAVEERERRIKELEDGAREVAGRSEKALAEYEKMIVDTRREAARIVNSARSDAQDASSRVIEDARRRFNEKFDKAMEEVNGEVESASRALKKQIGDLASSLAGKILGRRVSP
ncbi:MAG: F0F1 ATP synthase subunit B [Candidatus Nitrospinota bacterium M3_3B_026]